MKRGIRSILLNLPLMLAVLAVMLNLWLRIQTIQSDPLAIGHFVGPVRGSDEANREVDVPDAACHLIRYGSSQCAACRADEGEWSRLRASMLAKGCNVAEFGPSSNLMEQGDHIPGVFRLRQLDPEFVARTGFTVTPTMVLANRNWRIVWARPGALTKSDTEAIISTEPASLLGALLRPVEVSLNSANSEQADKDTGAAKTDNVSLDSHIVDLPLAGSPSDGPLSAPIVLVEFADFQCPFCARAAVPLRHIRMKYPNEVRLIFKQYPLDFHARARRAAGFSIVVGKEHFWQVYDELYDKSPNLTEADLELAARHAGVDFNKIARELQSGEANERINGDIQLGKLAGVEGTPTLFVNGQRYKGAITSANLERVVAEKLRLLR